MSLLSLVRDVLWADDSPEEIEAKRKAGRFKLTLSFIEVIVIFALVSPWWGSFWGFMSVIAFLALYSWLNLATKSITDHKILATVLVGSFFVCVIIPKMHTVLAENVPTEIQDAAARRKDVSIQDTAEYIDPPIIASYQKARRDALSDNNKIKYDIILAKINAINNRARATGTMSAQDTSDVAFYETQLKNIERGEAASIDPPSAAPPAQPLPPVMPVLPQAPPPLPEVAKQPQEEREMTEKEIEIWKWEMVRQNAERRKKEEEAEAKRKEKEAHAEERRLTREETIRQLEEKNKERLEKEQE